MRNMYEIRNYYFESSKLDEYREWASALAVPYIRERVDLVGFWIVDDEPPQIEGTPTDELGTATVTWIIKWDDMDARTAGMKNVFASDEWSIIGAKNPGREYYHRIEVKFAEAV